MKYEKGDKVVVVCIGKDDGFYFTRKKYVGQIATLGSGVKEKKRGFIGGFLRFDDGGCYFYRIKVKAVKKEGTKPELNAETARNREEECDVLSKPSVSY